MDKNKTLLFSVIILSISLIISSLILSNAVITASKNNSNDKISFESDDVLNLSEAANYLGISEAKLSILANENDIYSIPCLKVGDKYVFSKSGIEKWLETTHMKVNK